MAKLYVIGNGFDLWHNLPTRYKDFYDYAKNTLDEFDNYYCFDLNNDKPWYDFENALGAFDADAFLDFHNEIDAMADDFRPSFIYGLEDEITEQTNAHVSTIKETFTNWINQLDISQVEKKMTFTKDSSFITFNYTSTLQSVYEIDDQRILHIHGSAEMLDDLIFGHGDDINEPPEFDDNGDSNRHIFSDAQSISRYPLYALKKPVSNILKKNEEYFLQLGDIHEIVIIGHSLNKIDQPYFRRIAIKLENSLWKICIYHKDGQEDYKQRLIDCGIEKSRIEIITYENL
ncbi:bacteriophage abortive infection AbiH family protein [Cedecea sp. S5-13]|uniref:bacteriophage abortive infection AbiH family protein n=1 Tax=Cedecea selenatireducens TaxID=3144416 RepID=UPI0035CCD835